MRRRRNSEKSRYGGWPMKASRKWPGESAITCPYCASQDIVLTGRHAFYGTGPGGRGRMGDVGGSEWAECQSCGAKGYHGGEGPGRSVPGRKTGKIVENRRRNHSQEDIAEVVRLAGQDVAEARQVLRKTADPSTLGAWTARMSFRSGQLNAILTDSKVPNGSRGWFKATSASVAVAEVLGALTQAMGHLPRGHHYKSRGAKVSTVGRSSRRAARVESFYRRNSGLDWKVTWLGQHRWFSSKAEAVAWADKWAADWRAQQGRAPLINVVYQPTGKIVKTIGPDHAPWRGNRRSRR